MHVNGGTLWAKQRLSISAINSYVSFGIKYDVYKHNASDVYISDAISRTFATSLSEDNY